MKNGQVWNRRGWGTNRSSLRLAANSDNQLWTSIYTTTSLNGRFDLVANGRLRFGDDMSDLSQESFQGGAIARFVSI